VYSKLRHFIDFSVTLVLGLLIGIAAQAQAPTPAVDTMQTPSATTATLRGRITDPTGALIPGAAITVTNSQGVTISNTAADDAGVYTVSGLAPDNYIVQATYSGFAPFVSPTVTLTAGLLKHINIVMAVEVAQQSVTVSDEASGVNVEATGNASAIVLKGKDLDTLSDDPDELSNELTALAGPSAGPNGGQMYIDGFSGGQLPPKSAIREIRINQNPYSAEFDHIGFGRIEILTKPGTDKLRGQFFIQGNDKAFNTSNPFVPTTPSYYSYQFNGTLSGPISKNASFFVSAERRNAENINAWLIPDAVLEDSPGVYSVHQNYGVNQLNARIRNNASARLDWQLGSKNTITARYGFWSESEHDDLNQNSLPSAATNESNTDHTLQISDDIIINDHLINESRFQYERQNENHYPVSTDRTINVAGDFTGGGYSGQVSRDHTTRLEFQNMTTMSHGAHAIKFGTRMRDSLDANFSNANFNGTFTFAPITSGQTPITADVAYLDMANGLATGTPFSTLAANYYPSSASYTSCITNSSHCESNVANVFDIALFAQDDWKFNPRLTLSGGIRWEAQNHIADHDDWGPRVSMAYALDGGNNKKAKTVLRAGYGFFYDRMGTGNLLTVERANVQNQLVFNFPACTSKATSLSAIDMSTCTSTGSYANSSTAPVKYEIDSSYHAPYMEQAGVGLERQLNPGTTLTVNYLHSFGIHQTVTRNANQAVGGVPQNASGGYLYEYFPEAIFKENQIIANVRANVNKNINLTGFYTLSWANSNSGSASNAYDLNQGYGRAAFVSRNMLFLMGNYTAPWGIRFSPFMVAQSGRPYNVTLATDPLNGLGNQRPTYATSATPLADQVTTPFGILDDTGQTGTLIPINLGNGPAALAVNLRISRGFGIGPKLASTNPQPDGGPPQGGPPPGAGPGGGHGGGGGYGGGRGGGPGGGGPGGPGGMFGGGANTGHKYSLNFSVQALNLFNDIDYGTPTGTLNTPNFGKSTSLAGGIFSQGSAARRVFAQVIFSF